MRRVCAARRACGLKCGDVCARGRAHPSLGPACMLLCCPTHQICMYVMCLRHRTLGQVECAMIVDTLRARQKAAHNRTTPARICLPRASAGALPRGGCMAPACTPRMAMQKLHGAFDCAHRWQRGVLPSESLRSSTPGAARLADRLAALRRERELLRAERGSWPPEAERLWVAGRPRMQVALVRSRWRSRPCDLCNAARHPPAPERSTAEGAPWCAGARVATSGRAGGQV